MADMSVKITVFKANPLLLNTLAKPCYVMKFTPIINKKKIRKFKAILAVLLMIRVVSSTNTL